MKLIGILFSISLFFWISCGNSAPKEKSDASVLKLEEDSLPEKVRLPGDTVFNFERSGEDVSVHFYRHTGDSEKSRGTIVLLPGWNYSVLDWCTKTSFCKKAKISGYDLIMVDMAKSMYALKAYPQTRQDMKKQATRGWFLDTLIPYFQVNYELLLEGENNLVLGLSTGGRGSALLCLDRPEIFRKGAALSGDFNQAALPNDNLTKIFYGPYQQHKKLWEGEDNIVLNIDRFNVPMYLGHGLLDPVVTVDQTLEFYEKLTKAKPDLSVKLHIDSLAKHDYNYWNSEVDNVLDFFGK